MAEPTVIMKQVPILEIGETGLTAPSRIESLNRWRIALSAVDAFDGLYRIVDSNKPTREKFIAGLARSMQVIDDGICPLCRGYNLINDQEHGLMWCMCALIDWLNEGRDPLRPYRSVLRKNSTFDSFETRGNKSLADMLNAARYFAENPTYKWLVISGGVGTGKSHVLEAIAKALGPMAFYLSIPDNLNKLVFGATEKHNLEDVLGSLSAVPVLLLDDWGFQEHNNPFVNDQINRVIQARYVLGNERPTVLSTNEPLATLKSIDARIGSRLREGGLSILIQVTAQDYRLKP